MRLWRLSLHYRVLRCGQRHENCFGITFGYFWPGPKNFRPPRPRNPHFGLKEAFFYLELSTFWPKRGQDFKHPYVCQFLFLTILVTCVKKVESVDFQRWYWIFVKVKTFWIFFSKKNFFLKIFKKIFKKTLKKLAYWTFVYCNYSTIA